MQKNDAAHISEQIDRIRFYESILTQAEQVLSEVSGLPDSYHRSPAWRNELAEKIRLLDSYYGSPAWKEDLEADEEGRLPKDLRRGVLSEDGIYNVLTRYEDLYGEGDFSNQEDLDQEDI